MNVAEIDAASTRENTADTSAHAQFRRRWSPRAMSGDALTHMEIATLLEAARWAPSCFNAQPWRFAYVLRADPQWQPTFDTLIEGNQVWAQHAGALIAVISRREYEHNGKPAATHSFDTGAAWMSLALQAAELGLVAHGMQGFDQGAARRVLSVPAVYDLPAMIAVGRPGNIDELPDSYAEREVPSSRKPLQEIAFAGGFEALQA